MKEKDKQFSITTKAGDKGKTRLLNNSRVEKYDLRPEAYGTLDEASAFLGLIRAQTDLQNLKEACWEIQNHIYWINAELACPVESLHLLRKKLGQDDLAYLEAFSTNIESKIRLPRKFVIYGETVVSAYLDVARAVLRRAERRIAQLNTQEPLQNPVLLPYLNRLSDTLYLMARYDEFAHHVPFAHPDAG